jgi:hypothetical protein
MPSGLAQSIPSRKLLWDWISPYGILASRGRFSTWLPLWHHYRAFFFDIKADNQPE